MSPFTNKTHLFTMLSVVGLFTVFRIAGGGTEVVRPEGQGGEVRSGRPTTTQPKVDAEPALDEAPASRSLPNQQSDTDALTTSGDASPSIDDILKDKTAEDSSADSAPSVADPKEDLDQKHQPGGLDEIAKALGMP